MFANSKMMENFPVPIDWLSSNELHMDLFYTADEKGYIDYPVYEAIDKEINHISPL